MTTMQSDKNVPASGGEVTMDAETRMKRVLTADPDQLAGIDAILSGERPAEMPDSGPLLLGLGASAKLLGTSRATFWRMLKAGRLPKVELLPGSFRIRRRDIEALVGDSGNTNIGKTITRQKGITS